MFMISQGLSDSCLVIGASCIESLGSFVVVQRRALVRSLMEVMLFEVIHMCHSIY